MAYIQSNWAFAGGIQELSLEEISFVSGGVTTTPPKSETPQEKKEREERERKARAVCEIADALQVAGAAAAVVGGVIAAVGLVTGPAAAAAVPIGGAIAAAGGSTQGAGYLIGKAGGCPS